MGGTATATGLGAVQGVYVASNGDVYLTDGNNYIYRVRAGVITAFAGTGAASYSGDGGPALAATLNNPRWLGGDAAGNIYVADLNNFRIRIIDPAGNISTVAGTGTNGSTGDGGLATAAAISSPRQVVVDPDGNIFISEVASYKLRKIDHATGIILTISGTGTSTYSDNVAVGSATLQGRSGMTIYGSDLYFADTTVSRIRKAAGVAATATNNLQTAKWTVNPPAVGHTNLRERFVVTPSASVTASKITAVMPTSFAASSPSSVVTYGLSGAVTPSVSGTTLTLSFTSQTLTPGIPIAISFEGITNGGATGVYNSYVTLFDSAGTTQTGWALSNVMNITGSGAPTSADAGFGSMWQKSLSTTQSAFATVAVSPAGTTDSTSAFTLTNTGNLNANAATLAAGTMTTGARTLSPITTDSTTSVASASFATNRWGLQFVTSTGASSTSGSGFFSGLTSGTIATGAGATNVLTTTARAKVDYLQPAGTYKSTLTWRFTGGV